MKFIYVLLLSILSSVFLFTFCTRKGENNSQNKQDEIESVLIDPADIVIEKTLLYDQHTLLDTYPYRDTIRVFQWDKIRVRLAMLETLNKQNSSWAILQNYKNRNGEAPLVKKYVKDVYKRNADTLGIEQYQASPLYSPNDLTTPERYGRDGSIVKYIKDSGDFAKIQTLFFPGEWMVPKKYIKHIADTTNFRKVIFVDRKNQNITTLEKLDKKWLVRSMNPATTGLRNPPYQQETPLGIFVLQDKKPKMLYLKDGSNEMGGFAPYANRFCNGGYIHGVPINSPRTQMVEFSNTLGTTPRSHMCVRNATSHAKFIYNWAPIESTIVFVID